MLLFIKSAPSQGQVNSPNAQLSPPALAPGLPCVPSTATEPRPWAPLPENGPQGGEAAGHLPFPPCSPPASHCCPVLGPDPLGEGPIALSRASVWGEASVRRGGCPAPLGEPVVWGWALRAGWLGEVVHPCDGGLTEEAVLVVHQVLVDAGFA